MQHILFRLHHTKAPLHQPHCSPPARMISALAQTRTQCLHCAPGNLSAAVAAAALAAATPCWCPSLLPLLSLQTFNASEGKLRHIVDTFKLL